jgi:23S rRNA (guanosine2251-2'-O)-methyltransferase
VTDTGWIVGRNPVREALRAGRPIHRILVADGATGVGDIVRAATNANVRVDRVPRGALTARAPGNAAHQGVAAEVEAFRYRSWTDGIALARERGEPPMVLVLDGITDAGNLGSLLRTAEAAGCHAVVLPSRRSAHVSPAVEKAAAGATAHLLVDRVTNLGRTIARLREAGVWVVALDPSASEVLYAHPLLKEPVAVVVGAEGAGVSRLVAERADVRVRIPLAGRTASLNAAVAGAIALFEAVRVRNA